MRRGKTAIGVFDSGFGGLSVLRAIVKRSPQYSYTYLGDTARAPYGDRSADAVYEFTRQALDFLFANGCDFVILACNTASSEALRKLQREYIPRHHPGKHAIGVLVPFAEEAAAQTRAKRVGVLATTGTVRSGAFPREITKLDPTIAVSQQACPLLVSLVEAGEHDTPAAAAILRGYLAPLAKKKIDTLVLGCTHYGLLKREIKRIIGPRVRVISEEEAIPRKLEEYLKRHPEIETRLKKGRSVRFFSTDASEQFRRLGSAFFGRPIRVENARLA